MQNEVEQLVLFDPDCFLGKMSPEVLAQAHHRGRTIESLSRRFAVSQPQVLQSLDLSPGAGNLLGESYWQTVSPWLGESWTPSIGAYPLIWKEIASNPVPRNGVGVSFLSQILQAHAPRKYYLTRQACLGILRRAEERGKALPRQLWIALRKQAGLSADNVDLPLTAFAANQRDEVRDLHDVSAAICAQPGVKQQTFVAGFCAGAGPSAGNIGYQEEVSPTLKGSPSGNMAPTIICLNDQGGQRMDVSEEITGTLRADMGGHQPLVAGVTETEIYCIISNAIDREPQHGGNGLGYNNEGVCYTVTSSDRHAICEPYQETVGTLVASDCYGVNNQYVDDDKCVVEETLLIRRLMPIETERLQGFPDGWTDIEGASDTARYKAMGNSVAIPCVEFIMAGIAGCLGGESVA